MWYLTFSSERPRMRRFPSWSCLAGPTPKSPVAARSSTPAHGGWPAPAERREQHVLVFEVTGMRALTISPSIGFMT